LPVELKRRITFIGNFENYLETTKTIFHAQPVWGFFGVPVNCGIHRVVATCRLHPVGYSAYPILETAFLYVSAKYSSLSFHRLWATVFAPPPSVSG